MNLPNLAERYIDGEGRLTRPGYDLLRSMVIGLEQQASQAWTYISLESDSVVSTTALADVPGMSFAAAADTSYEIEIFGAFQTAATTTGIGIALNIPSGTVIGMAFAPSGSVLATQTVADDAVLISTGAVASANSNAPVLGKYIVSIGGTGGTVQLRQSSSVAASNSVLKAGLWLKYRSI